MSLRFEPRLTRDWDDPSVIGLEGYVAKGGYQGLSKALAMTDADIVEVVKSSGLRGRGGAGFPAGMKWGFVPRDTGKPTYVVVNFDESAPGTCNNRELVERDPHRLLEGMAIAALAIARPPTSTFAASTCGRAWCWSERSRRPTQRVTSVPMSRVPASASTPCCTGAPVRTSAARRRRC